MTSTPSAVPDLPRVLVFSEGILSPLHGTGVVFRRLFSSYPSDRLANWYIGDGRSPLLSTVLDLNPARWHPSARTFPAKIIAACWNRLRLQPTWPAPVNRQAIANLARSASPAPDIVYAIAITRDGIDTVRAIMDGLPPHVSLVLQLYDFRPSGTLGFWRALRKLSPRITEVWALTDAIANAVRANLAGIPVRLDSNFYHAVPTQAKDDYALRGGLRAVMLGNLWNPALMADVRKIWKMVRASCPSVAPIVWHCHPAGVSRLEEHGQSLGEEVVAGQFLLEDQLFSELRTYDLALLPFSAAVSPESEYERYSLPSRLAELTSSGLPIVCLTGPETPLARLVNASHIAAAVPAADHAGAAALIAALKDDSVGRERLGRSARQYAETHYRIEAGQAAVATRLCHLAERRRVGTQPAAHS